MLAFLSVKILFNIIILTVSANYFIQGTITVAKHKNLSPMFIGIFLIGFATTAPELIVSFIAIYKHHINLALGNAFGSYIANIGMVIGITALIKPIRIDNSILKQELPLLTITLIITVTLLLDRYLGRLDAIILLLTLIAIVIIIIKNCKKNQPKTAITTTKQSFYSGLSCLIIGLIIMLLSSSFLVDNAVQIAQILGFSELAIGVTIIAIGTSLPELITAIICVLRNENSMAIGNIIGSNILVILAIAAVPGIISPGYINDTLLFRDCIMMIVVTLLFWLFSYNGKNQTIISRTEGLILTTVFFSYLYFVVVNQ